MSEVKVNKISPRSGTDVTLGDSGDNFIIPSGATLTNNGSASGFASIAWQSAIKTASFTAVAGEGYWVNTTSSAITITLPASASVGDQIIFTDYARTWGTNAVTVNQNSLNFQGNTSPNPQYNTNGQSVNIVYSGATGGWIPTDDDTTDNKNVVSAEYLVVAGGASGAGGNGGGGGAGGYLTNYGTGTIGLTIGATYTATVGGGGSSVTGNPKVLGNNGSDSVLSGTGISTITAIGGGGGGTSADPNRDGLDGGSGGGGGGAGSGGSGTVGQGNDGGAGTGGGGGGAGESGNTDGQGFGGDGLSNSITGSATFYAGGGGGGVSPSPGTYPGGDGGGGDGKENPNPGVAGTANLGGGGGGCNDSPTGAGGSGVVILRVPTADYSGTTTGSPTVTTDGTDTVIKFTSSGSYTA